jgi:hypothetical protein
LNDEWRIGEDEIETVVEVLWDLLWLVEIVLEIVCIVLSKFLIELTLKSTYIKYKEAFWVLYRIKDARG